MQVDRSVPEVARGDRRREKQRHQVESPDISGNLRSCESFLEGLALALHLLSPSAGVGGVAAEFNITKEQNHSK